jgi:hypothetical protein
VTETEGALFDDPSDAGAAPLSDLERERVAQFLLGEIVAGHRDQGLATDRARELAGARRWARENPASAAVLVGDIAEMRQAARAPQPEASA